MLLPIIVWSQIAVVRNDSIPNTWAIEKPLDEQYLDWCNADSNKVVVGYTFILSDRTINKNGWFSQEFYNPKYRQMFVSENPNYIKFIEMADWDDPNHVWYVAHKNEESSNKYYEVIPIKRRIDPTFEGFIKWKKRFKKN
jgi:hypothetical protein